MVAQGTAASVAGKASARPELENSQNQSGHEHPRIFAAQIDRLTPFRQSQIGAVILFEKSAWS
jgi:hypothetical protein